MRKHLFPVLSLVGATVACAVLLIAIPVPAGETSIFTGCSSGQGPDEWLPGVVTTVLPTTGTTGTPRRLNGSRAVALKIPSGAAGTCYATIDAATLTSTGARGFDIVPGDPWTVLEMKGVDAALRVICTAQLATPKGLKVFLCR